MISYSTEEWKNYRTVLRCIESTDLHTRASLAKQLGLSRTTTSLIATYLINRELIEEQIRSVKKHKKTPHLSIRSLQS